MHEPLSYPGGRAPRKYGSAGLHFLWMMVSFPLGLVGIIAALVSFIVVPLLGSIAFPVFVFGMVALYSLQALGAARARKLMGAQLVSRQPPTVEDWAGDPSQYQYARAVAQAVRDSLRWPNDHFYPLDPFTVMLQWDIDLGEAIDALNEMTLDAGVVLAETTHDREAFVNRTFSEVVTDVRVMQLVEASLVHAAGGRTSAAEDTYGAAAALSEKLAHDYLMDRRADLEHGGPPPREPRDGDSMVWGTVAGLGR